MFPCQSACLRENHPGHAAFQGAHFAPVDRSDKPNNHRKDTSIKTTHTRNLIAAVLALGVALSTGAAQAAGYAGSVSCRECHEKFYQLWSTSYHGLAMQPYTAEFAKKNLTPQAAEVKIGKFSYRADISGSTGWVRERGPGGEKKYRIEHALGGKNVYYFLTPMERGGCKPFQSPMTSKRKSGLTPLPAASATSREASRASRSTGKTRPIPSIPPATAAT